MTRTSTFAIIGLLFLTAFSAGCISIRVSGEVDDPRPYFDKAYAQIERIHQDHPHREGRPHRLCLLIHDNAEHRIVKLSVPLWIVNACLKAGVEIAEHDHDFDFEKRYDLAWRSIKDLSQVGPGLLVEVVDDKDKVLIWLK